MSVNFFVSFFFSICRSLSIYFFPPFGWDFFFYDRMLILSKVHDSGCSAGSWSRREDGEQLEVKN